MEEKVLFKVKSHKFVTVIAWIFIVAFVGAIALCTYYYYNDLHGLDWKYDHQHTEKCVITFDDVTLFTKEDYLAVKDKYPSYHAFVEDQYPKLIDKSYHDQYIDCDILKYGSVEAANNKFYEEYGTPLSHYINDCMVVVVASLIPLILIIILKSKQSKFVVTESNIYGKKGYKKFNISYDDIIDIEQKANKIIIKISNKVLKLSALKKCDEIYNYIKPFVPEKIITQQSTSEVDDIKLF